MTQEELDSLMTQDADSLDESFEDIKTEDTKEEIKAEFIDPNSYKPEADRKWPPPPPTEEHKVVHQLDDVTRDSEVKMTEVFDQIDNIGALATTIEKDSKKIKEYLKAQEEMLITLVESFPKIKAFAASLEQTKEIARVNDNIRNSAMDCNDACMQAMDIMQYQDIHRQKIERVINVMRALSKYMNSLFESNIDDKSRAPSAVHLEGDRTDNLMSDDDIEALINSLGKK